MAEKKMTALQVAKITAVGMHPDGGGLYLQVTTARDGTPRKSWVFRFSVRGKDRYMGLGCLAEVSLADARKARDAAREKLRQGIDPIEHRQAAKQAKVVETAKAVTFDQCRDAYIASHEPAWRNARHRQHWRNTLRDYASPIFGNLPVDAIDTSLVMMAIEPIWTTKSETASRVRGRIESILAWATVRGFRQGPNPAVWRNHLDQLLPKRSKVCRIEHHEALPYLQVPAFMAALRKRPAVAARALEFLILTAARTGEVIGAKWEEIDLEAKVWTIPAGRMKADREHRVPLSEPALVILKDLAGYETELIFFGERTAKLSNMAMAMLLRRMKIDVTVHGFRSSFRDWAGEETLFPREICEAALAHTVGNAVEVAYRRGDALEKRRGLMESWAVFCGAVESGNDERGSSPASRAIAVSPT